MAKPVVAATKTKDNSRKRPQQREEWTQGKKIGRPSQQWNAATQSWGKIMEPKKVTND